MPRKPKAWGRGDGVEEPHDSCLGRRRLVGPKPLRLRRVAKLLLPRLAKTDCVGECRRLHNPVFSGVQGACNASKLHQLIVVGRQVCEDASFCNILFDVLH